jgi:hypothetical protein
MTNINLNAFSLDTAKGLTQFLPSSNVFTCQVYKSLSSGTKLTAGQPVKLATGVNGQITVTACSAETDKVFGVIPLRHKVNGYEAGDLVEVASDYCVVTMEAAAATTQGAAVKVAGTAYDQVTPVTGSESSTPAQIGIALDAAAAQGDLIRVLIKCL